MGVWNGFEVLGENSIRKHNCWNSNVTIARYFIHVKEVGGASVSGTLLSSSKKGNSLAQVPEEKIPNSVVSGRACSELSEVGLCDPALCLSAFPFAVEGRRRSSSWHCDGCWQFPGIRAPCSSSEGVFPGWSDSKWTNVTLVRDGMF